jgi:hypothetical protein
LPSQEEVFIMRRAIIVAVVVLLLGGIGAYAQMSYNPTGAQNEGPDRARLVEVKLNSSNFYDVDSSGNPTKLFRHDKVRYIDEENYDRDIYEVTPRIFYKEQPPVVTKEKRGTPFYVVREIGKVTTRKESDIFVRVNQGEDKSTTVTPFWKYQIK